MESFVWIEHTADACEERNSSSSGPVAAVYICKGHDVFANNVEPENAEDKSSDSSTESNVGRNEWDRWFALKVEVEQEEIAKEMAKDQGEGGRPQ